MKEICGSARDKAIPPEETQSLHQLTRGTYARRRICRGRAADAQATCSSPCPAGKARPRAGSSSDGMVASRDYEENEALTESRVRGSVEVMREAIHDAKGMLQEAGIEIGSQFEVELSHHHGPQQFRRFGAVIINLLNREYCKKLIVVLPGPAPPRPLPQGQGGDLPRPPRRARPLPGRRVAPPERRRHAAHRARAEPRVPLGGRLHHRGDLHHPRPQGLALQGRADRGSATPWPARPSWRPGERSRAGFSAPCGARPSGWGGAPITEPVLPRLALSSWTRTLRARSEPSAAEWSSRPSATAPGSSGRSTPPASSGGSAWRRPSSTRPPTSVGSTRWPALPASRQLGFWAGVGRIPRAAPRGPRRLAARVSRSAEGYRAFARDFAPTVAAYDLHVEEHEEGPLRLRLPAGRDRGGRSGSPRRARPSSASSRENPVARVVCYSGLIGRSPALCEAARRAGVEVLTVEGWAWRPGPHDLQPRRAGPRIQRRGLAARRSVTWDVARERETDRLLQFQEGTLGPEGEAAPATCTAVPSAPREPRPCPQPSRPSSSAPGRASCSPPTWSGDSSMLRREPDLPQPARLAEADDRPLPRPPRLEPRVRAHPDEARSPGRWW